MHKKHHSLLSFEPSPWLVVSWTRQTSHHPIDGTSASCCLRFTAVACSTQSSRLFAESFRTGAEEVWRGELEKLVLAATAALLTHDAAMALVSAINSY